MDSSDGEELVVDGRNSAVQRGPSYIMPPSVRETLNAAALSGSVEPLPSFSVSEDLRLAEAQRSAAPSFLDELQVTGSSRTSDGVLSSQCFDSSKEAAVCFEIGPMLMALFYYLAGLLTVYEKLLQFCLSREDPLRLRAFLRRNRSAGTAALGSRQQTCETWREELLSRVQEGTTSDLPLALVVPPIMAGDRPVERVAYRCSSVLVRAVVAQTQDFAGGGRGEELMETVVSAADAVLSGKNSHSVKKSLVKFWEEWQDAAQAMHLMLCEALAAGHERSGEKGGRLCFGGKSSSQNN